MVTLSNQPDSDEVISSPLPLCVRESLMRGLHEEATQQLVQELKITEEQAEALILEYKADLKERNTLLEIQLMKEKMLKESKQDTDKIWVWGSRLLMLVVAIALLYVLTLGLLHRS